ncbi:MAG: GFA family protein [Pseudomonadota bacterium]
MKGQSVRASCHCRAVQLMVQLDQGLEKLRRCNCSICSRHGAIVASVLLPKLHIIKGQECLREYRFNTGQAVHYFCSICGIYTHHHRRSTPTEYSLNIACLDGIKIEDFYKTDIPILNGRDQHPSDQSA